MILPERVFGSSSVKMIVFGLAIGPIVLGDVLAQLLAELVARLVAAAQDHERDDRLAGGVVVGADDRGLGHRRVVDERGLDLGRSRCCGPTTIMTSSTRPSSQK